MNEKLTFEAFYPDPPERVWQALTDPDALAQWLMPANFQPEVGFRFRFKPGAKNETTDGKEITGTVLEAARPTRLSYTWEEDDNEDNNPGVVSWTLKPKDGGTLLTLEHAQAPIPHPYVLIEAGLNWNKALRRLQVPIVYVTETEEETKEEPKRRAGFRQEEIACKS